MAVKKRRTKKQIAATKKLVALNRKRARMSNPKKKARRKVRAKVKVGAKSRVTKKRPKARLKRRREKNTKEGYYPNPATKQFVVFYQVGGIKKYFVDVADNGKGLLVDSKKSAAFKWVSGKKGVKLAQQLADAIYGKDAVVFYSMAYDTKK